MSTMGTESVRKASHWRREGRSNEMGETHFKLSKCREEFFGLKKHRRKVLVTMEEYLPLSICENFMSFFLQASCISSTSFFQATVTSNGCKGLPFLTVDKYCGQMNDLLLCQNGENLLRLDCNRNGIMKFLHVVKVSESPRFV